MQRPCKAVTGSVTDPLSTPPILSPAAGGQHNDHRSQARKVEEQINYSLRKTDRSTMTAIKLLAGDII